jgi:hypothetical protein
MFYDPLYIDTLEAAVALNVWARHGEEQVYTRHAECSAPLTSSAALLLWLAEASSEINLRETEAQRRFFELNGLMDTMGLGSGRLRDALLVDYVRSPQQSRTIA